MRDRRPVPHALVRDDRAEVVLRGVHRARAHAAAGRRAGGDHRVRAEVDQVIEQVGAVEGARLVLDEVDVRGLGRDLGDDLVAERALHVRGLAGAMALPVPGTLVEPVRAAVHARVEDRDLALARRLDQSLAGGRRPPSPARRTSSASARSTSGSARACRRRSCRSRRRPAAPGVRRSRPPCPSRRARTPAGPPPGARRPRDWPSTDLRREVDVDPVSARASRRR